MNNLNTQIKKRYDALILNFWTYKNMGGLLQAWALQKIIKSLGYENALINKRIKLNNCRYEDSFVERFANEHLQFTEEYGSAISVTKCNLLSDTIILGSDCIWGNWWPQLAPREVFCGSFIDANKKIISYAPSFGNKTLTCNEKDEQIIKFWLQRIDFCSVRETSGVEILNKMGINATQVIDPTLLLKEEDYFQILNDAKFDKSNYIFNYSIGIKADDEAYKEVINKLQKEDIISLDQKELDKLDVADWLYRIKNSRLLITNSYHACCFSIIFKVPFLIFAPYGLDTSRFDSLLGMLNLQNRILHSKQDVDVFKDLFKPVDWDKVNSILEKEKERSLKWLKDALETPKDLSRIHPSDAMIKHLNDKILDIQEKATLYITQKDFMDVLEYNQNYRKYIKYKILKNFVFGKTRGRYKRKQKIYHEKIKSARHIKKSLSAS